MMNSLENVVAEKLGQVMEKANYLNKSVYDNDSFGACVGIAFWQSFGRYEQSTLMQSVYMTLCNMGFTPTEEQQIYEE